MKNNLRSGMIPSLSLLSIALGACQTSAPLAALVQAPAVPIPQMISLEIDNYIPASGHTFKNLFVSNFSVVASRSQLSLSSSKDGLSDTFKDAHTSDYGFSSAGGTDSNSDYFSDLFVYLSGITLLRQSTLFCATSLQGNQSNDAFNYTDTKNLGTSVFIGLHDCEKNYLGLDPTLFDFDGDGIPDYLELRCGLNPKNAKDAALNPAADGITNIEKCKRHLPIDENGKTAGNVALAYQYKSEIATDGTGAYKFTVSNIAILNGGQDNFIALYLTETDTLQKSYLSTAYIRLGSGVGGTAFKFPYWGTGPTKLTNQEIILQ
jgi:hypothetical protein